MGKKRKRSVEDIDDLPSTSTDKSVSQCQVVDLFDDVLREVFRYCTHTIHDLFRLVQVCRQWQRVVNQLLQEIESVEIIWFQLRDDTKDKKGEPRPVK